MAESMFVCLRRPRALPRALMLMSFHACAFVCHVSAGSSVYERAQYLFSIALDEGLTEKLAQFLLGVIFYGPPGKVLNPGSLAAF